MILLIDNYDSFVHNLARYVQRLGVDTLVRRNDAVTVDDVRKLKPAAIVLSPGPGYPDEAGISVELVKELHREFPLLGICLGHQAIAEAFGGRIVRLSQPMHGRTSLVFHEFSPMFTGVPSPFEACRYHSLIVKQNTVPAELAVTAACGDGTMMALEHQTYPTVGLQFHPEAILTRHGYRVLSNFLRLAGIDCSPCPEDLQKLEFQQPQFAAPALPSVPLTF